MLFIGSFYFLKYHDVVELVKLNIQVKGIQLILGD